MKQVQNYQQNFAKGEIDPQLSGSSNLQGYYDGLSLAENVWITDTGAAQKRYGMIAVASFASESTAKMFPFINTRGDRFLFVALPGKIEVYRGDSADHSATLNFPGLTAAAISNLCTAAYGDSIILTEETLDPTQIKWLNGNNFSIETIVFADVPTYEFSTNDDEPDGAISFSAKVGYATATTSTVSPFQPSDVGKYISVIPVGRMRIDKYNNAKSASGYLEEELLDATADAGNWVIERGWAPLWDTTAHPAVCAFHEGRLLLGNFPKARSTFAFSVASAPFAFSTGDGSAAFGGTRNLSVNQGHAIYHLVSSSSLYAFCADGEFVVDQSLNQNLRAAQIRHNSSRGVVRTIRPLEGEDGGLFFFQPNSTGISEFRYYMERGSYEAYAFSKFGGHLLQEPCAATLWKGDRDFATNILFYVNGDGSMVACTVKLAERIMAFTRIASTHPFADICVCGSEIYVLLQNGDDLFLRRFTAGIYTDAGTAYASTLSTLPINAPQSPYAFDSISNVAVVVYMSDSRSLFVNGSRVYVGPPYTGEIRHFMASGWMSKGSITLSDGASASHWAINNIGRSSLSGGAFQ
jgi:hypothetical protein